MNEALYTCVNCQTTFHQEQHYKEHYRSEHHRYNVKRKLIGLAPLSLQDYTIQFSTELSSKSQSQAEIYCELCSKKFMSAATYKQHLNSQKHKNNRKQLLKHDKAKSETSSVSEFEVIGEHAHKLDCILCGDKMDEKHLASQHCFPPFREECINVEGLIDCVGKIVQRGDCVYCGLHFATAESAKQHMNDMGHGKLNLGQFQPYEAFYLWKIEESSSEEDEAGQTKGQMTEVMDIEQMHEEEGSSSFKVMPHNTLQSIEARRQNRVKYGVTGAIINGKEVGYRSFKQYYKQHLTRKIEPAPRQQLVLTPAEQLKQSSGFRKPEFSKLCMHANPR